MKQQKQNENEIEFLMYYHTAIRNMGIYITIGLVLVGIARYYRENINNFFNILSLLISNFTLLLSFLIGTTTLSAIESNFNEFYNSPSVMILKSILVLNGSIMAYNTYYLLV